HVGVTQDIAGVARTAVDDGNADRCTDDDVVPLDRVGRADGGNDAPGGRLQGIGIGGAAGDDGELVAAEPGNQIVAAHHPTQALRDLKNELVADMVAERIVDILEVIEIDVEHGRRRAAVTDLVDHGLQSFTEIDAVGQAADRIVQSEAPQLRFAGGDGAFGAPHVPHHQANEHGQTGNRDGNEG